MTLGKLLNFSELQFLHGIITANKWDNDLQNTLHYVSSLENGQYIIVIVNQSSARKKKARVVSLPDPTFFA